MKKTLIAAVLALGAAFSVQAKDIVETAVAAGNFKTLATALTAAGLVDTLKGKGPFTVFAPTDAAFAKIPKADLDALLKDKAKLTAVLTYHVVAGKVMAADVKAGKVKTVQGSELTVSTTGGVMVDKAKVTTTDIVANNGEFRALHGFNFTGFHVCRHHFAGDHMVGEHGCELGLVFEQGIQVGFRNLCKSGVCRCKNREWSFTFEGINQASSGECRCQGFEIAGSYGRLNDIFGLYAKCCTKG